MPLLVTCDPHGSRSVGGGADGCDPLCLTTATAESFAVCLETLGGFLRHARNLRGSFLKMSLQRCLKSESAMSRLSIRNGSRALSWHEYVGRRRSEFGRSPSPDGTRYSDIQWAFVAGEGPNAFSQRDSAGPELTPVPSHVNLDLATWIVRNPRQGCTFYKW